MTANDYTRQMMDQLATPTERNLWMQLRAAQNALIQMRARALQVRVNHPLGFRMPAPVDYAVSEALAAARYVQQAHAANTLTGVMVQHADDQLTDAESMLDACAMRGCE